MLRKVNKALLISEVPSFSENFRLLAEDIDVTLIVEEVWNYRYRINADLVILGSKYLKDINEAYYPITVIILREGENPTPFIKMGINRFIFNYKNNHELIYALYKPEAVLLHTDSVDYDTVVQESQVLNYQFGDYDFKFDRNQFKYKGKFIYLGRASKKYLAEWLLNGNKDNSKRMTLYNLRKKFGDDFLRDIDRFGEYIGGQK